ncbi:hypothetical protein DTO212C5_8808 [Paecilomyces variotii]|nr:hypothetical protein DTO212C5_8808 [Paecilomyces variotii]
MILSYPIPSRQSARPSNLIFPSLHSPSRLSSLVSRAAAVDLSRALASLLISSGGVGRLLLPIERCESNRLKASQDCSLPEVSLSSAYYFTVPVLAASSLATAVHS